ncbi:hypothetical protein FWF48_02695 [Candidatus Saccharibacteria bacterium]|nr:hypothetical protein [Candidatus Saccharibacteria bacterium]
MSQKENKSVAKQLDDLKQKIDWFYGEDFKLDEALKRYEEVIESSKSLEKQLGNMKNKVEQLAKDFSID